MKKQEILHKLKNIPFINHIDVIIQIISALGILVTIIEVIGIIKTPLEWRVESQLIIKNVMIFLAIISINIYGLRNKRNVIRLENLNRNLTEVNDKVRCFRHDFNNIIQAIDGYITLKDMDSLQTYFKSLVKECNYVNSVDFLNNKVKENPAIYSIVLGKYRLAEENNIKMNIEVLADLSKIKDNTYSISRMLGILLDNAIEASIEAEEKIINVIFMKEEIKNRVLIKIENTYLDKEVDLGKIFEKEYSTKVGNSGLGLWKVRDILSKDTTLDLFTTKDDYMFRQQLEIYG